MAKHHIQIPELQLTERNVSDMLGLFYDYQDREYHFVPPDEKCVDLGLNMLVKYKRNSIVHGLESKVRFVRQSYFLRNTGVEIHSDMKRTAVIGFELSNPENAPTRMFDDDRQMVEEVFYDEVNAILWDTTCLHAVAPCAQDRIFFQMELERHLCFEDYVELYEKGELFRW